MSSHRAWSGAAVCLAVAMWLAADDAVVTHNVNLRPDPSTSHRPLRLLRLNRPKALEFNLSEAYRRP
jgi:hypothetical protein